MILFQTRGGEAMSEVRLDNESVWITADQMTELFQRDQLTTNDTLTVYMGREN